MRAILRSWTVLLLAAASLLASPAHAAWFKAETDRFIVYGEGERKVREYAEKLQTYDAVLRAFHPSTAQRVPNTKLQLYLLRTSGQLRDVQPRARQTMRGFYTAMNEGVFAFAITDEAFGADDILFHEYAHHFMLENFPAAYPAWFLEGFAEYFSTTELKGRDVIVGGYNPVRAYEVLSTPWVPLTELLTRRVDEVRGDRQRSTFYSQAWLLMHYMRSEEGRAKQLDAAIRAISAGAPPLEAMQKATGRTPEQLTADLRKYRRLPLRTFSNFVQTPSMTLTRLPASADTLLLDHQRLLFSSTRQPDPAFLAEIRRDAARHPDDPFAQRTLARAEAMFGDHAKGEAIVDALLKARPDDREAWIAAGWVQLNGAARNPAAKVAHLGKARQHFGQAYKLDQTDFRTLFGYAYARSQDPNFPTDNDIKALLEARALAPAVDETAFYAGMALLAKGRRDEAALILARVVNNPHGGGAASAAKALLQGKSLSQTALEEALQGDEETREPPEPAGGPTAPAPAS